MAIIDDNVLVRLQRLLPHLNPALKRVAACALKNPNKVKLKKISEFAADCGVSVSTVTRFVKALRMGNYPTFKIAIAEAVSEMNGRSADSRSAYNFLDAEITRRDSFQDIVAKIAYKAIDLLKTTKELISPQELEKAVAAIERARNIVIYCSGASVSAGQNVKVRFYKVGKNCVLYSDATEQAVSSSLLSDRHLVFGISNSGRTKSVISALRSAKECGATCVCITGSADSPIVAHSDIKFYTSRQPPLYVNNSMISRIPDMMIIDVIYACYISRHYAQSLKMIRKSTRAFESVVFG
jgi:RpiR family transcriptional regulator, carbohydrate utilization regulator